MVTELVTLYRPVGQKELDLIRLPTNSTRFAHCTEPGDSWWMLTTPGSAISRKTVREKISLLAVPGDACWKEREDLCERHKNDNDGQRFEFARATRLVEAISR